MRRAPIKVLFLSANPDSTVRLRTDRELQSIHDALRAADLTGRIEVVQQLALQVGDLQRAMLQQQPDVVHFSGHGTADGDIVLEEPDGNPRRVDKAAIAEMLSILKERARVVVLNACCTQPLAMAIAEHVECAVGMNDPIKDRAAVDFSAAFYRALGYGKSVQDAFAAGRNALRLLGHPDASVPELFTRIGVDAGAIVLVEPMAQPAAAPTGENILLLVDLASDNPVSLEEVMARLPRERPTQPPLRATEFDAVPKPRGAVEFTACAEAIQRMIAKARDGRGSDAPEPHYYIAGRAALPIFAHLGMELSAWTDVTLINQRRDGSWDVLPLRDAASPKGDNFFEPSPDLDPTRRTLANGRVAVFISTNHPPNEEAINRFFEEKNEPLAGVIQVRTKAGKETFLDASNAPRAMAELNEVFNRIRDVYPRATKLALFIAGPATLAFMAARAINRNIYADVWVPNYEGGVYHPAAELPWKGRSRSEVSAEPEAEKVRIRVLRVLCSCIRDLQQKLKREHLPPPPILMDDEAKRVLSRIQEIAVAEEPQGEVFDLRVSERKMSFGLNLLEVFRSIPERDWKRAGQLIFLHELFQQDQNLQSPLHAGGGRAGFALAEVDYWADAMAVGTLATSHIQRGGEEAAERLREIVPEHVDAMLSRLEAFDRFKHGDRIDELAERQLRRYLVWHLQRARAATLRSVEDLWQLFGRRLIVEMAPLRGHLDERFDKVVSGTLKETEIFVVVQRQMMRIASQPHRGIDASTIVKAVRRYDRKTLLNVMEVIRESHRPVLTPWAP